MTVLDAHEIQKSFGNFKAVDSISFEVERGNIYGLLGPNGAGKTTTIRMIMNILVPDSGSINLFGQKMDDSLKAKIGYLPEERGLYQKMKVKELLAFMGEIHGLSVKQSKQQVDKWLEKMELSSRSENKVEELSKGMQQKLQFISTIIHEPDLVILDEPFSGLDPVNVNLLKDIMLELKSTGKAIIFSTHMMEAAEKLCDHIFMINKGKKVLDGPLLDIQKNYGNNSIHLEYQGEAGAIRSLPIVSKFDDYGNYAEIELIESASTNDFIKEIVNIVETSKIESKKSSLNEIFIGLAGGNENE